MMANDILGINPKYKKLIKTKLTDVDSYNTFMELVECAKSDIIHLYSIKTDIMRDTNSFSSNSYYLYKFNRDANMEYDGTMCPSPRTCKTLKEMVNGISAPRLTKYVNAGLMSRGHNEYPSSSKNNYYYYLPWDFFTTNDLSIKFSPNPDYEVIQCRNYYNF